MSRYRAGTLDDWAVTARRERRAERVASDAARPTRSQSYQTTRKVEDFEGSAAQAAEAAAAAQQAADDAERLVAHVAQEIGEVVLRTSQTVPTHDGTWTLIGSFSPIANVTLYAYERTE